MLPSVNEKGAKINATYKQPNVHTVATLDVFKTNFSVNSVVGRQGFLAGGEVSYNVLDGKVREIKETQRGTERERKREREREREYAR